jgi:hypothetical protein
MSIYKQYRLFTINRPSVSLGGRWAKPRPILSVTLIGPGGGTYLDAGLLDTGSDEIIYPLRAATIAGIDLANAPSATVTGVGFGAAQLRYAEVTLRIAGSSELREWRAWVGFTSSPLPRPLLGFAGFLQFFTAQFFGDREEFDLTVNRLYPGT